MTYEMADYVIPPKTVIVKCSNCQALYVPELDKSKRLFDKSFGAFEQCPVCGYEDNRKNDTIPLWKYNLIKFFRECFK